MTDDPHPNLPSIHLQSHPLVIPTPPPDFVPIKGSAIKGTDILFVPSATPPNSGGMIIGHVDDVLMLPIGTLVFIPPETLPAPGTTGDIQFPADGKMKVTAVYLGLYGDPTVLELWCDKLDAPNRTDF